MNNTQVRNRERFIKRRQRLVLRLLLWAPRFRVLHNTRRSFRRTISHFSGWLDPTDQPSSPLNCSPNAMFLCRLVAQVWNHKNTSLIFSYAVNWGPGSQYYQNRLRNSNTLFWQKCYIQEVFWSYLHLVILGQYCVLPGTLPRPQTSEEGGGGHHEQHPPYLQH